MAAKDSGTFFGHLEERTNLLLDVKRARAEQRAGLGGYLPRQKRIRANIDQIGRLDILLREASGNNDVHVAGAFVTFQTIHARKVSVFIIIIF